jgi:hypothetical protein
MRRLFPSVCALALAALAASPAFAGKAPNRTDIIWQAPDFAGYDVRAIAMLPIATFDNSAEARRFTEAAVGQTLRGTGYRWVPAIVTRDEITRDGGDSLLKALNQSVLKLGRLDSLDAPRYSRMARTRALFTVRVDRFERMELPFDQSGKPTTTVQLTAAIVDSTGRLLWSASGAETAEGPYQDASSSTLGVRASGLNNTPITGQGGAPTYLETLNRLLTRWLAQFPVRPAAATVQ